MCISKLVFHEKLPRIGTFQSVRLMDKASLEDKEEEKAMAD